MIILKSKDLLKCTRIKRLCDSRSAISAVAGIFLLVVVLYFASHELFITVGLYFILIILLNALITELFLKNIYVGEDSFYMRHYQIPIFYIEIKREEFQLTKNEVYTTITLLNRTFKGLNVLIRNQDAPVFEKIKTEKIKNERR